MTEESKIEEIVPNENSILESTKKLLGIMPDYEHFDMDLIIYINSAISILRQIGIGPKLGYRITSKNDLWGDFIGESHMIEDVKSYIYLRCRLIFDPPTNSFLVTAIENQITELTWRLSVNGAI